MISRVAVEAITQREQAISGLMSAKSRVAAKVAVARNQGFVNDSGEMRPHKPMPNLLRQCPRCGYREHETYNCTKTSERGNYWAQASSFTAWSLVLGIR